MQFLSMSRLLVLLFAAVTVFFSPAGLSQGAPAGKAKYFELNPAQPTEPGKIEVLEFFSYACSHCAVLEPLFEKWKKTLPADVVVKPVPVAFNASMKPMQLLFYTLEAMNRLDLHGKVFVAIHEEKKKLFSKPEIIAWATSQGLDRAKFESVYDSFGVTSKAQRGDQLTTAYKIQGTPSVAVAGRFVTSPSEAGGYQETLDVAGGFIKQLSGK